MLVSPLDWGLGHATRCVPLIHELIALDCQVIIASDGRQQRLLCREFPHLKHIELTGYQVTYAASGWKTKGKLLLQIPGILSRIRYENQRLKDIVKDYNIQLVISDNRYGLYHEQIPSVFITHQLLIKTSFGQLADRLLQRLNYRLIERFSACWVPDKAGDNSLAGELSHPALLPSVPVEYIGALSRLTNLDRTNEKKHILVILSGPEPQRTMLERKLLEEFATTDEQAVFIRGLPGEAALPIIKNPFLKFFNDLPADDFSKLVSEAKVVVCRSGYSSVMDLIPAGIRCAFIPTPGQPEQIYLAHYLAARSLCLRYDQHLFTLTNLLEDLKKFHPASIDIRRDDFKIPIRKTLNHLLGRS